MDRTALIAQLSTQIDQAELETISDTALAAVAKALGMDPTMMGGMGAMDPSMMPADMAFADMPREDLIAALVEVGEDPAALEPMSDEELQMLYDEKIGVDDDMAVEGDPAMMEDETPVADDEVALGREEMIEILVGEGEDPAALEGMSDDELETMIRNLEAPAEGDGEGAPVAMGDRGGQMVGGSQGRQGSAHSRRQPSKVTVQYAEINRKLNRLEVRRKKYENGQQALLVRQFVEAQIDAGRILPTQRKTIIDRLKRASSTRIVRKFNDRRTGRVVGRTELAQQMFELRTGPVLWKMGEVHTVTTPERSHAEIVKVQRFAAMHEKDFRSANITVASYVETFKAKKKLDPNFTADQYING